MMGWLFGKKDKVESVKVEEHVQPEQKPVEVKPEPAPVQPVQTREDAALVQEKYRQSGKNLARTIETTCAKIGEDCDAIGVDLTALEAVKDKLNNYRSAVGNVIEFDRSAAQAVRELKNYVSVLPAAQFQELVNDLSKLIDEDRYQTVDEDASRQQKQLQIAINMLNYSKVKASLMLNEKKLKDYQTEMEALDGKMDKIGEEYDLNKIDEDVYNRQFDNLMDQKANLQTNIDSMNVTIANQQGQMTDLASTIRVLQDGLETVILDEETMKNNREMTQESMDSLNQVNKQAEMERAKNRQVMENQRRELGMMRTTLSDEREAEKERQRLARQRKREEEARKQGVEANIKKDTEEQRTVTQED